MSMPLRPGKSGNRNPGKAATFARTNCASSVRPRARAYRCRRTRPPCNSSGCRGERRNCRKRKRRFERGRKISRASAKDVGLHGIGERGGQRVLVILKLGVELMERAFPQVSVPFDEERAKRALRQRFCAPDLIPQDTEFHIDIG